jgi:hypothetical protein
MQQAGADEAFCDDINEYIRQTNPAFLEVSS